jgi:glycosyltransferase involved in cell wall biosynthesis
MQILFFGTFDERTHPRVRVLREGIDEHGHDVEVCNVPLDLSTDARVAMVRSPWRAMALAVRIATCWARLLWRARGARPDVVVVGYLGHFDVHLARLRFRRATVVLDHMVGLGDTVRDRGLDGPSRIGRVLDKIDGAALRAADVVVVDTLEQAAELPDDLRATVVVVAVGAPRAWALARSEAQHSGPLRVVFFGVYTPLQGAVVIGDALHALRDVPLTCTMIGRGQDLAATRSAAGADDRITWLDWVDEADLAPLVAEHDVCLGIFGDGPKALRVVPNKVYQGAAAGCAIVTSDTPPQRRVLDNRARLVPVGSPVALAGALRELAGNRDEVGRLRSAAATLADEAFTPFAVVAPLLDHLKEPA